MPEPTPINSSSKELVDALEARLKEARAGKLIGMAAVWTYEGEYICEIEITGTIHEGRECMGAANELALDLIILEKGEDEDE